MHGLSGVKTIFTNYPFNFLEMLRHTRVYKNKKNKKTTIGQDFFSQRWSIEGCITKVVERIVMNVGSLIPHKT